MADEIPPSGLEQAANEATNAHAPGEAVYGKPDEPKKPVSTLESVVNETSHLFGNTLKLGLAGAVPLTFASAIPSFARDTAILTGAQVASDYTISQKRGKKYTSGNILESAVLGTAMTPVLETMFRTVNAMPQNSLIDYAAKGSVWGGVMYPFFVGAYQPIAYFIRNRTFRGMGKYIKENYWTSLKDAWTKLLPLSLANIFFAPAWLQIPISAGLSYLFDLFGAPQKGELKEHEKKDKTPYYFAAPTAASKLVRNSAKALYEPIHAIGSAISDLYKTPKTSASAATPAPPGGHV